MNTLSQLLSSRVKAEILGLLFGVDALELHVREIARRSRLNEATVRQELRRLTSVGVVVSRRDGNRTYYRAKTEHPLYKDLRNIVSKTSGLVEVLRESLRGEDIQLAFVFGSIAAGDERPGSDVDLMIVGSVTLRELTKRLSGVAAQLGRELNPHIQSPKEFARRRVARDHFLTTVLKGPKLFITGDELELAGLGG